MDRSGATPSRLLIIALLAALLLGAAVKSHPIAQALAAGLLQDLGACYGDAAMAAAGEQLARRIRP